MMPNRREMKKCSYCGKEYPDEEVRCSIDHEPLIGGESQPIPPILPVPEAAPTPSPAKALTDRQMRIIEVVLVCAITLGPSILASFHYLSANATGSYGGSEYRWFYNIVREGSGLALLWYVLTRSGRTFGSLGLSWKGADVGWSLLLYLIGTTTFYTVYSIIYYTGLTSVDLKTGSNQVGYYLFGNGLFITTMLFQLVNPFFEELIVRAYVMTEVRQLTNSVGKAVFVSVALQTSYHLYQGVPAALSHAAEFLIYSIFYAKTNRIAPVLLAHLYLDVGSTLFYCLRH